MLWDRGQTYLKIIVVLAAWQISSQKCSTWWLISLWKELGLTNTVWGSPQASRLLFPYLLSHTYCPTLRALSRTSAPCQLKRLHAWPHASTPLPWETSFCGFSGEVQRNLLSRAVTSLPRLIGICSVACGRRESTLRKFMHQQTYGIMV